MAAQCPSWKSISEAWSGFGSSDVYWVPARRVYLMQSGNQESRNTQSQDCFGTLQPPTYHGGILSRSCIFIKCHLHTSAPGLPDLRRTPEFALFLYLLRIDELKNCRKLTRVDHSISFFLPDAAGDVIITRQFNNGNLHYFRVYSSVPGHQDFPSQKIDSWRAVQLHNKLTEIRTYSKLWSGISQVIWSTRYDGK